MKGWLKRGTRAIAVALGVVAGAWGALWAAARLAPFPASVVLAAPRTQLLLDREGRPLRVILDGGGADRRPVALEDMSPWIGPAMIAAEDRRFWHHPGVDPLAILRALGQNLLHGRVVSGASTLSTQVIRMAYDGPRTLATKVFEAFRALQLEQRHTKREILALYLNRAPFGANLYGVQAASRAYFGKDARDLSLGEAALLAGLPQSPSRLRPDRHDARAKRRRDWVLGRMRACGFVDEARWRAAVGEPVARVRAPYPFAAPHFCDFVARQALSTSAVVRTTLDLRLQETVGLLVARGAEARRARGIEGAAALVLEVRSGAVRAMVGSPDFFDDDRAGQVNAAAMPRSPGSTLKPFLYAMAFDEGRLAPGSVLADVPRRYADYRPGNFDESFRGPVSVREALVQSLNMPALAVLEAVGVDAACRRLRAVGLDTIDKPPSHYGLGLALGNAEVRLADLASAYACLARGGESLPYRLTEEAPAMPGTPLFSPEACYLVADILGGPERLLEAAGHQADARMPRIAWKTGTSAGRRDAWTFAWNPEYVVGVWVGNPDGRPDEDLVGGELAAPLAWDIFRCLYPSGTGPWFAAPRRVKLEARCAACGERPGPCCPETCADLVIAGVTRETPCTVHRRGPDGAVVEVWPPRIAAFLRAQAGGARAPAAEAVEVLSPEDRAVFRVDPFRPESGQRIQLRAQTPEAGPLYWFVDGLFLGSAEAGAALAWSPAGGRHRIVCADAQGRRDTVDITVE